MPRSVKVVIALLALALLVRTRFEGPIPMDTACMEPTIAMGRHVLADKLTIHWWALKRGNVLVLISPLSEDKRVVRRVIGLPGDIVEIRNKRVLINDLDLPEPYAQHAKAWETKESDTMGPVTVPARSIFVLGDNRDLADDSSSWKNAAGQHVYFVPFENVIGIARKFF